jgi:hypothetical protein
MSAEAVGYRVGNAGASQFGRELARLFRLAARASDRAPPVARLS